MPLGINSSSLISPYNHQSDTPSLFSRQEIAFIEKWLPVKDLQNLAVEEIALIKDLYAWIRGSNPVQTIQRMEIAGNIWKAYKNKSAAALTINHPTALTISHLSSAPIPPNSILSQLTNLQELKIFANDAMPKLGPRTFAGMQSLEKLDFSRNRLNEPELDPSVFDGLDNLQDLKLSSNQLTSAPDFNKLSNLQSLNLSFNSFTDIPTQAFNKLDNLKKLDFSNNQLTSTPDLNWLINLQSLDLSHNQLTSIPESLLRLPATCTVYLQNNRLSEMVITQLRDICSAPGYNGPRIHFAMVTDDDDFVEVSLSDAVAKWFTQTDQDLSAFSTTAWTEIEKEDSSLNFSKFLGRLHNTVNSTDPVFHAQIVDWLTRLASDPELRKEIFLEAKEGIATCEDRVSLTLNAMKQREITLNVLRGNYDNRLDQLIPLARQQYRLNELAKIAYAKVKNLRFVDEVDAYLAYQVKLREALELKIDTKNMRWFGMASVTEDDLQTAALQVKQNENQHFLSYLASEWTPWQSVLKRLDPQGYEILQNDIYEAKTNQLTSTQNTLLIARKLPNTEANRLGVTGEALQIIADKPNRVFTKVFLQTQENKVGGTPGLSALLNPVWKI